MSGFKFAVDDFGSGFSSLIYLKHFPIDFIKIEGEFVKSLQKEKIDRAFVKAAVALAKELNIYTIAEYVESEEILEILKNIGVDYSQGFFIGKPAPYIL